MMVQADEIARLRTAARFIGTSQALPTVAEQIVINGGKPWWALTGSNRRHLPCKGSNPMQNCHFFAQRSRNFASVCRFRSRWQRFTGSYRTTQALQVLTLATESK